MFILGKPFRPSLWVRLEKTKVEHLSVAPLLGRLLGLPSKNRLGWRGLPVKNTLTHTHTNI
jgi:hypothetical protein